MKLPVAAEPFLHFAQMLRQAGFAVSPDQTMNFLEGVGLLGPRDLADVFQAGKAIFAVPPEMVAKYEALFRAVFFGELVSSPAGSNEDEEVQAHEPTAARSAPAAMDEDNQPGSEAVTVERLSRRSLAGEAASTALVRLKREAAEALPRRLSYRRRASNHGDRLDLRRILREAAWRDGDVLRLSQTRRSRRQRRILLLIDVSGSMKDRSENLMRLGHAVVQAADRAEVFTFGTRLTRITSSLRPRDASLALTRASEAIADFDGGTRIGEALEAYLAVPRYAGYARGAAVIVISDGLERGSPDAMAGAVSKIARRAWRLEWLTPLAVDPAYAPETLGMKAVLPHLDRLGDGSTNVSIVDHILSMARAA